MPRMRCMLYSSCASSTWSLPSALCACSAKMSRITRGAVDHAHLERVLEARAAGSARARPRSHDDLGLELLASALQLLDLARADVGLRVGCRRGAARRRRRRRLRRSAAARASRRARPGPRRAQHGDEHGALGAIGIGISRLGYVVTTSSVERARCAPSPRRAARRARSARAARSPRRLGRRPRPAPTTTPASVEQALGERLRSAAAREASAPTRRAAARRLDARPRAPSSAAHSEVAPTHVDSRSSAPRTAGSARRPRSPCAAARANMPESMFVLSVRQVLQHRSALPTANAMRQPGMLSAFESE